MTRDLDLTPINDIMDSTIFHLLCSFTLTRYTHTNPLAHCFTSCKLQTTVFGENAINILKGPHPSWRFGKPLQSEPSEPCSLPSDSFTDCHLRSTRGFIDPQTGSYIAKKNTTNDFKTQKPILPSDLPWSHKSAWSIGPDCFHHSLKHSVSVSSHVILLASVETCCKCNKRCNALVSMMKECHSCTSQIALNCL